MLLKVFRILLISNCFISSIFGSSLIKCISEDFERSFLITPSIDNEFDSQYALIRMKYNGKVKSQELNYYKVTKKSNFLIIKANSRFQNNLFSNILWNKILKIYSDFKINLKLNLKSKDGSGKISLLIDNSLFKEKRLVYEVSCKRY